MTPSNAHTPSTEDRQLGSLEQLLDYQKAIKQLLNGLPEAGKTLMDLVHAQVQSSFRNQPLPIALNAVHYEEYIRLTLQSGSTLVELPHPTPRLLTDLFNNKPWAGQDFEAPNRLYRYTTKAISDEVNPSTPSRKYTVHRTTVGTPAFERFIDELLRSPDRCYQQQLDGFWCEAFAPGSPLTRDRWLAEQLGKAVAAEATLRVADQTLAARDKALIDQIIRTPSSQAREHLPTQQRPAAFSVRLKGKKQEADIPLAGVFIVSSKTPTADIDANTDIGSVVLFTPDKGIDSFTSLLALDQALRSRFAAPALDDSLLSAISWQDHARAQDYQKTTPGFCYKQIQENLFENCVHSLLTLQKQDIAHGWRQLPRHETDAKQVYELFNRLAHIGPLLDIRNRLIERSRRYIDANLPSWYLSASTEHKQALNRLTQAELLSTKNLVTQLKKVSIPTLPIFARNQLIRQLAIDHPGKVIDPDLVSVKITHSLNPASLGGGIGPDQVPHTDQPATRTSQTMSLSLTALALRNIDPWDFSFYKIFTGQKTSMSAHGKEPSGKRIEFNERYLTSLVQRLDVSKGYDQLLQTQLLTDRSALRKAWTDAHRASLACAALAARLSAGSLFENREHRGYQWIEAIAGADIPASRNTVNGHKIVASSLLIANSAGTRNGYVLNDVLMISVEQRKAVPNVILYTPGAPSEQAFKEFADIQAMQLFLKQQWAESPDWRRYVMQRLSKAGQSALTESKASRTQLLEELILSARSRIGSPFETIHPFAINTPLHDALYEQRVSTLRRNADHDSTSNAEVAEQSRWNKITFGMDLALNLIEFLPIASAFKSIRSVARVFLLLKQAGLSKSCARALWSITGANRRPRLVPRFAALPAPLSAPDLSGVEVQVRPTDLNQIRANLFQSKTGAQQYALIGGKHYLSDVAQGNRFIYPPGISGKTLRYPLIEDAMLENWHAEPMPRLRGGMDPIEKGPLQTTYQDYELPAADRAALPALNQAPSGSFGLGILNPALAQSTSAGVLHIFAIQSRLRRHARTFFKTFRGSAGPIVIPPRDLLPEPLLGHLFDQRNGLVLGESHNHALTRRLLIENMPALKRQGLGSLYLEQFNTDLHQDLLDTFNLSPTAPLPPLLRERLQLMDTQYASTHTHTYVLLVEEAHAQGIRVMALDATATSQITPRSLSAPGTVQTLSDQLDRVTMFNFFAYKRITFDQRTHGPHRWVALVGHGHCSTLQGIPGLADLTTAISMRPVSRIPTLPLRISHDPGVLLPSPLNTHKLSLKCDVLVCMADPISNLSVPSRVHSPHLFMMTNPPQGGVVVHYMNARYRRLNVPVLVDGTQVYVDRIEFGTVHNRRFIDLGALADALVDELHMIEV